MTSKTHKQIADELRALGRSRKSNDPDYAQWISATDQIEFLKRNAQSDEIVMYASNAHVYIMALAVPRVRVEANGIESLVGIDSRPDETRAGYVTGGGREDVWVEPGRSGDDKNVDDFIFVRRFQEWKDEAPTYIEIMQEYAHLAEIHWRDERSAYCRLDGNGDIEEVVSITIQDGGESLRLVTFKRKPLELYLAATDKVLARKFDFLSFEPGAFRGWPDGKEESFEEGQDIHCVGKTVPNHAGYRQGVNIVRLGRHRSDIFQEMRQDWGMEAAPRMYETFIAMDWRNRCVRPISTDPRATTSYWEAEGTDCPFELSPAFFHVDVLQRYKSDSDKYLVEDRRITCRDSWNLRGFDINEEGQVHAYICDLRHLPYREQSYWKSFNERPKGTISRRAMANDFEGRWWCPDDPLLEIKQRLRGWESENAWWWKPRSNSQYDAVSYPSGDNRDEWGDAFLNLCKLVVEGFPKKKLTAYLTQRVIDHEKQEASLRLLKRVVENNVGNSEDGSETLGGMFYAQNIRTKVKSHSSGESSVRLAREAVREHGSLSSGFRATCASIAAELEMIEKACSMEGEDSAD